MTLPPDAAPGLATEPAQDPGRVHRRAEALTMALYVGLSLLAVMVALPTPVAGVDERVDRALLLGATSLSLLLAHIFAFRLSSRLVHQGLLPVEQAALLGAQVAGGVAVTVLAVLPVIVLGEPAGIRLSELLLLAFVAAIGWLVARRGGASPMRASVNVVAVVLVTLGILAVKAVVAH